MGYLLLASFLSGMAALNYELLWMRMLTLVAGSTQAAISCVLSVFFLGMALGNYLAGRAAARLRRPLAAYVGVELVIGLWAVVFGPLLGGMGMAYARAYQSLDAGSGLILVLRLVSGAGLLLVPTTCMGATLPLLAQFLARDVLGASRRSAWLYGINTLGATVGTLATGFFLIERFGVSAPLKATGLLNVGCVLCVLPLLGQTRIGSREVAGEVAKATGKMSRLGVMLLAAFGVLGFCNISAEVLWTRFYALIYPNDTYIFSTILLMYLLGIGAGSLAGGAVLGRIGRPVYVLGVLQLLSAAWTIGMIYAVPEVARSLGYERETFQVLLRSYIAGVAAGTLPQTLCMGATFALLVRAAMTHAQQAGAIVGRALAWNTIGGVLGASVAGFLLLDRWGLQAGILLVAVSTAMVGLVLCAWTESGRRWMWVPTAAIGMPVAALMAWSPPNLPDSLIAMHFPPKTGLRILETKPNVHGTVSVTEEASGERRVWINGSWVARERAHTLLGYVPWLLHPGQVRSALGICVGTGRTFGALLSCGIKDLDLVDINASVVALSRVWLARSNSGVLDCPEARVIVDDGRNFVRYGQRTYDLITLEPLQMFQKGVVYFYTEEFYREARARMADGAVLCQWMPLYLVGTHEFKSMAKTFATVFENSILWGRGPEMMLLGYNTPGPHLEYDEEDIYRRLAGPLVQQELRGELFHRKFDLFLYAYLDSAAMLAMGADGEVYTDERPRMEFTAPRMESSGTANLELIRPHLVPIRRWFDLPDERVADCLERVRAAQLDLFIRQGPPAEMQREFTALHEGLYRELEAIGQKP